MKTIVKIGVVTFSIIGLLIIISWVLSKKNYKEKIEVLNLNSQDVWLGYPLLFNISFIDSLEYPSHLSELMDSFLVNPYNYKIVKDKMKDPFSKQEDDLLYVPIYSSSNKLREGFLLISAGIDGKINTKIKDTIYFEDVSNLKFYNPFPSAKKLSYREYKLKYCYFDYLFGNSDLLVEFANGIDIYENSYFNTYTPTLLFETLTLHPKGYSRLNCCIKGNAKCIGNGKILVYDSKTKVICNMYKGRTYEIIEGDNVNIIGRYFGDIDSENNIVYLKNGILVNK